MGRKGVRSSDVADVKRLRSHLVADEERRIDESDDDHLRKEPRVRVPVRIGEGLVQRRRMALGDVALGVGARVVEPAQDVDAVRAVGDVVVEVREQREPSPSTRAEVDVELGEHVDDDRVERVGEAVERDL